MKNLNHFGIILGKGLADNLGVMMGDKVTIMIPQATVTPAGMIPRFKRFTVVGFFLQELDLILIPNLRLLTWMMRRNYCKWEMM